MNVKYILRSPATSGESAASNSTNGIAFTANRRNVENDKIRRILTHSETSLSPSFISRKSWCLPVNGKYPVQSAIQILKKLDDLGLGCLREISHPHNNKRSKLFVKRHYDDPSDNERAFVNTISISQEEFNASSMCPLSDT